LLPFERINFGGEGTKLLAEECVFVGWCGG
jgi:hypothetical protein